MPENNHGTLRETENNGQHEKDAHREAGGRDGFSQGKVYPCGIGKNSPAARQRLRKADAPETQKV
jgi:hypothetical protein